MANVTRLLERRLKLKINTAKSAVARPSQRSFLSLSFGGGSQAKRRKTPQALIRFKAKVRELTRCTRGASLAQIIEALSRYLIGWRGYFGFCETPTVLQALDQWLRRRLRAIAGRQWKRGSTRSRNCAAGPWLWTWRLQPPGVPMARAGSATAPP